MSGEKLNFYLKELDTCHAEISRRSTDQFRAVVAALLAIGTIIGLVSEFTDSLINLLVAVPWIHAVLGYVWVDNSYAIFRNGEYIRRILEPHIRREIKEPDVGYLKFVGDMRIKARRFGETPSVVSKYFPAVFFIFPSILALVAFLIYHYQQEMSPDVFSLMLLSASAVFTLSLYRHWRFSVEFIERVASEEVADKT